MSFKPLRVPLGAFVRLAGEDDAADVVKGVLGCKSTLTELLVDWMVRCSSPATTSTSSGGRTARVITTGAKAGAGLGSTARELPAAA